MYKKMKKAVAMYEEKMAEIEDDFQNLTQMHRQIKNIYTENTNITAARIGNLLKKDLWWDATKCLEEGLADEIWHGSDMANAGDGIEEEDDE